MAMHIVDADNEKESLLGDASFDNAAKTARTSDCPARARSWFQRSRVLAVLDIFLLLAIGYYIFAPLGSQPARPRRQHPPKHRKRLAPVASSEQTMVEGNAGLDKASGRLEAVSPPGRPEGEHRGGKKERKRQDRQDEQPACGQPAQELPCAATGRRAVVTLSLGKRTHFAVTRVALSAYAARVGAELHVVDSTAHPSLAKWNASLAARSASNHFIKLPMFEWFLAHFDQALFVDDDVLVSPYAPDLFGKVPCAKLGAVVEAYHKQGWHAMHGRSTCELYNLASEVPGSCTKKATRQMRIFNSGVMLMSAAHRPLLTGWETSKLECRILCDPLHHKPLQPLAAPCSPLHPVTHPYCPLQPLTASYHPYRCDQLYLNAMMIKHATCLHDLGTAFNLPGTQVRKLMMTTAAQRADSGGGGGGGGGGGALSLKGSPMAEACMIHLTVLPSKHHTSHYLLKRALEHTDVLQCSAHEPVTADRGAMAAALPGEDLLQGVSTYDITKIWCKGYADGCQLIAPGAAGDSAGRAPPAIAAPASTAADSGPRPPVDDSPIRPPLGSVDEDELPGAAQELMRRTAARSWDKRTVILLFATNDFMDLAINWAQAATAIGLTNFVLVCMDKELAHNFDGFEAPPAPLYP